MHYYAKNKLRSTKYNGFAIALAWPETLCKRAGAWYDFPMHYLGVSSKGYYKVGHAAVVLVDDETRHCRYFDFGRYHAPHGHGRVRSAETDHDLIINTKAVIAANGKKIANLDEILAELYRNPSTHGSGIIYGTATRIRIDKALDLSRQFQQKEFIPYGPFIPNGTNCSRFVSSVVQAGLPAARLFDMKASLPALLQRMELKIPLTISPTPMWILRAIGGEISSYSKVCKTAEEIFQNPEAKILAA